MEDPPLETVLLFRSRWKGRCMEYALVLQALDIRCEVLPSDGEFALLVHARDADRAREQLRLYLQENQAGPPRFDPRLGVHDGLACACLYGVTILLFAILQWSQAFSLDWWRVGMSHAGLVREGEWWRVVTLSLPFIPSTQKTRNFASPPDTRSAPAPHILRYRPVWMTRPVDAASLLSPSYICFSQLSC